MTLLDAIPAGSTVTIDSAPVIYVLEGHRTLADRFAELFAAVDRGHVFAVISPITLAEVLAGPLQQGRDALAARYRQALTSGPGWSLHTTDADVAELAARLRARHRLKLPDALQLATAIRSGSSALVTHDRDFRRVREIPILTGD